MDSISTSSACSLASSPATGFIDDSASYQLKSITQVTGRWADNLSTPALSYSSMSRVFPADDAAWVRPSSFRKAALLASGVLCTWLAFALLGQGGIYPLPQKAVVLVGQSQAMVHNKGRSATQAQPQEAAVTRRRAVLTAGVLSALQLTALGPAKALTQEDVLFQMEAKAKDAYNRRDFAVAEELFGELMPFDAQHANVWHERRGQVRVDMKKFEDAIADFNEAERLAGPGYTSLGLLNNRALAYEGLSRWEEAEKDYSEAIGAGQSLGYQQPYILNSRGNVRISLGKYAEAREDYLQAAETFQKIHNLAGAIYAQSNAALCLFGMGPEAEVQGVRELKNVARRAPGSIDARAALAAVYWQQGQADRAEESWGWACDQINSGILREGGPKLDGCAQYRDMDWLRRIRRWPPVLVDRMDNFLQLRRA